MLTTTMELVFALCCLNKDAVNELAGKCYEPSHQPLSHKLKEGVGLTRSSLPNRKLKLSDTHYRTCSN
jgi:hypothetical protein